LLGTRTLRSWAGYVPLSLSFVAYRHGVQGNAARHLSFLSSLRLVATLLLSSGSMQIYSDSLRYYLPLRRYQIEWDEVRSIEIDSQGSSMVFVGENKRLAVNGPMFWTGKDKRDAARLIAIQIDRYEIEVRTTEKAMFRLSRNTRVGA
jgi:hypothetical protein